MHNIDFPAVEHAKMAIGKGQDELGQEEWRVYVINRSRMYLHNLMVVSKGYGHVQQEGDKKTSVLRHHFDELPPERALMVEPIDPELFKLANEFWLSYYIGRTIYDKRFIFLPESVVEANMIKLPIVEVQGVLHD